MSTSKIETLCQTLKITSRARYVGESQAMAPTGQWSNGHCMYRVTLYFQGKQFATDYHCNPSFGGEPQTHQVLACLALDAHSADESFEDWCDNLGFDSDSIKDLACYQACQKTRNALVRMFGKELEAIFEAASEY